MNIAIIGSGISGLSCAWLLSQRHRVRVFEADSRCGGHSHTVRTPDGVQVDAGFIVYNEPAYPNLTALFRHLEVPTQVSDMSFAASLDGGAFEYAGTDLRGLLGQPSNLLRPRFWTMLRDLLRFYREAAADGASAGLMPLGEYLESRGYGAAFRDDHLLPMAAAIWSAAPGQVAAYPTQAFLRFCENHHLLQVSGRPAWRTVSGGSREYVRRLVQPFAHRVHLDQRVVEVRRDAEGVAVRTDTGWCPERFDHVVVATHADQALRLLPDASEDERRLLGAFRSSRNEAVLHRDVALMPRRRAVWASWNYIADRADANKPPCVTYWMNRLQALPGAPLFVTLNPVRPPRPELVLRTDTYEHPLFDAEAMRAQRALWTLQGRQRTWFCGAWFGSGFHEDGLQAGLAVAEALGGVRRPWSVANESARIHLQPLPHAAPEPA